jgi:hypothetical protein
MKRMGGALMMIGALACATPAAAEKPQQQRQTSALGGYAQPGEIVAMGIAYAWMIGQKGYWNAVRNYAASDGQIIVGETVLRAQLQTKGALTPSPAPAAPPRKYG